MGLSRNSTGNDSGALRLSEGALRLSRPSFSAQSNVAAMGFLSDIIMSPPESIPSSLARDRDLGL